MKRILNRVYQNSLAQNIEGMTGYLAWAIVCYLTLSSQPTDTMAGQIKLLTIVLCLLLFVIGFYFTTRERTFERMDTRIRQFSILGQFIAVILIRTLTNSGVVAILSVALAAQLPVRFSRLFALLGALSLIAIDYYFNAFYWFAEDALVWTALAGAFNLFAFRMSQRVIQEQDARAEIGMLNRELIATQALLEESSKQSERLRISRDLHDGLGHHLTALILKLQYLTYTTQDETKQHVTDAHGMAKQLLTDVRETVHEMREGNNVGLKDALDALISQIPRIKIALVIEDNLHINDVKSAETLFRCVQEAVTNTMKHGNASTMDIHMSQTGSTILLSVRDNGQCSLGFTEGNGLKGMRERIEKLRGKIDINTQNGFGLNIQIPLMESL